MRKSRGVAAFGGSVHHCSEIIQHKVLSHAHANSLAKEFSEILTFEYFGHFKTGCKVFFYADSGSSRVAQGKNATLRSYRPKTAF